LKILFYSKGLNRPKGGAQSVGFKQYSKLSENNNVHIIPVTDLKFKGEIIHLLPKKYRSFIIPRVSFIYNFIWENWIIKRKLNQIIELIKPDVIHIHGYGGYYPRVDGKYKNKTLLTIHDEIYYIGSDKVSNGILSLLEKLYYLLSLREKKKAINNYGYFQALSNRMINQIEYAGGLKKNIFKIFNSIDDLEYKVEKRDDKKFEYLLMLSSIENKKRVIDGYNVLNHFDNKLKFVHTGGILSTFGRQYYNQVKKHKNRHKAFHLKRVTGKKKFKLIKRSIAMISLSRSESFGLTILEALKLDIPVIMTKTGATDYFKEISDKIILLDLNYTMEDLQNAVIKLLYDDEFRRSKNKLYKIKSWRTISEEIEKLYNIIKHNSI